MPSRSPRPTSTRRRSPTCIRAPWRWASSRRRSNSNSWPRPARMRPATAAAMPEVSADFKTFTFRIRPGIHFADDPAFKGRQRELTAEDYVYSIKRHYDPRWKSGNLYILENAKILGLSELRKKAASPRRSPSTTTRRWKACARSTATPSRSSSPSRRRASSTTSPTAPSPARWRARWSSSTATRSANTRWAPAPSCSRAGSAARASCWRGTRTTARCPTTRRPPADDARLQAVARQFKGRKLPLIDEVHISVIEETQPRWLSFLNEEQDLNENVPAEFANLAFPNNVLAPQPGQEGHPDGALRAFRRRGVVFRHGAPGGRRLRAAQGGAAPRHQPGGGHRPRDPAACGAARPCRRRARSRPRSGATTPSSRPR